MTHQRGPSIQELTVQQITDVLALNSVGRIAFLNDGRLELHPIHYSFADGCVFGRTSFGAKYLSWTADPDVAFGVDEIDGPLEWRSDLSALSTDDLTPYRQVIFRIESVQMSGRAALQR